MKFYPIYYITVKYKIIYKKKYKPTLGELQTVQRQREPVSIRYGRTKTHTFDKEKLLKLIIEEKKIKDSDIPNLIISEIIEHFYMSNSVGE